MKCTTNLLIPDISSHTPYLCQVQIYLIYKTLLMMNLNMFKMAHAEQINT